MEFASNAIRSVVVMPVTNQLRPVSSVLPERFVSDSMAQPSAIMGDQFGSFTVVPDQIEAVAEPSDDRAALLR